MSRLYKLKNFTANAFIFNSALKEDEVFNVSSDNHTLIPVPESIDMGPRYNNKPQGKGTATTTTVL